MRAGRWEVALLQRDEAEPPQRDRHVRSVAEPALDGEGLFVQRARRGDVPLRAQHIAKPAQRVGDALSSANMAPTAEALVKQRPRSHEIRSAECDMRERGDSESDGGLVLEFSRDREALLEEFTCRGGLAL